jgi:hypothetical protein
MDSKDDEGDKNCLKKIGMAMSGGLFTLLILFLCFIQSGFMNFTNYFPPRDF